MEILILVGVILAFVGVVWYLAHWIEEQRTQEYAGVARKLGLEFYPLGDAALLDSLGRFSLFQLGHSRKLKNLIRGQTQNVDLAMFDYSYTTGGGKSSSTHRQTVARFDSAWLDLPRFELRPAHMGHRIAKLFGYQDIAFPEFPRFSKKYLLRGDKEDAIRNLFNEDVIGHLEAINGIHIQGDGSQLLVYRPNKRLKGHELKGFMEEAFGVYAQFKAAQTTEVP